MEAEPYAKELYLTVAPEKITLPPGAEPPRKGDSVKQAAADYDRLVWYFGNVVALAPPTMTVLNTDPGTPNPYAGMPSGDAFKLLLGSLSDAQWQALTGTTGLGDSDLTGDAQHAFFQALFPAGTLTVQAVSDLSNPNTTNEPITLTADDLKAVRLHLGQKVRIGLPIEGQPNASMVMIGPVNDGARYAAYGGSGGSKDTLYGASLRQTLPNTLKPSDLGWNAAALAQNVPLDGVKTVGDLIQRVGAATKLKVYADRRYEKRSVILLGLKSAPAKDLLRALALCVTGAYRRVGSAFVLTDDRLGLGVRQASIIQTAQEAGMARHAVLNQIGDKLILTHGGVNALPTLDGDLGFSGAQKALAGQPGQSDIPSQGINLTLTLAQLTPQQQDLARRQVQQWTEMQQNNAQQNTSQSDGTGRVTLNGKFQLTSHATLQLTSPKVPEPVVLEMNDDFSSLFQPSSELQQKLWEERNKRNPPVPSMPAAPAPGMPLPALGPFLSRIPRRAVRVRTRTAAEVDSVIASMKTIGLNQLWLDVFWNGKSLLDAHVPDGKPDILTEALARTKGTGIIVVPTLDLLKWGPDAPEDARDLTLTGENSAENLARRVRYSAIVYQNMTAEEADKQAQAQPDTLSACPASMTVQKTLEGIVRRLAGTSGVASLALRETVTRGYDRPADAGQNLTDDDLGYVPALRLAFLRRDHVDPIDLASGEYISGVHLALSVPGFDDRSALGAADKDWNGLRYEASRALMQRLLVNAQQAAGRRIPFLVKQRNPFGPTNWYGLWDDPRAPLPELSEKLASDMAGSNTDYAAFAHTQSRTDVYEISQWSVQTKDALVSTLQQMKPGWDGIVLDFTADSSSRLGDLAKSVSPPLSQSQDGKNPEK